MVACDVIIDGHSYRIFLPPILSERFEVIVDGSPITVRCHEKPSEGKPFHLETNSVSHLLQVFPIDADNVRQVVIDGSKLVAKLRTVTVQEAQTKIVDNKSSREPVAEETTIVRSPLPGKILSVKTRVGAEVAKGYPLLVVEAMKMENEILSPRKGIVAEIHVSQNDDVKKGDRLITIS